MPKLCSLLCAVCDSLWHVAESGGELAHLPCCAVAPPTFVGCCRRGPFHLVGYAARVAAEHRSDAWARCGHRWLKEDGDDRGPIAPGSRPPTRRGFASSPDLGQRISVRNQGHRLCLLLGAPACWLLAGAHNIIMLPVRRSRSPTHARPASPARCCERLPRSATTSAQFWQLNCAVFGDLLRYSGAMCCVWLL